MKYIAVFCSAKDLPEQYTKPTEEFAELMAENGYGLVWGGSDVGLMKVIAAGVRKGGGKLVGISIDLFAHVAHKDPDEMIIAKDLGERKAMMLERSDAVVMLPGGTGTLDEIMDVIEERKNHLHDKPIVILNVAQFYDGFKTQLLKMKDEGFLHRPLEEIVYFADTPEEAVKYINNHLTH
jgi:uncharacterized protein (TIGR00730 family)